MWWVEPSDVYYTYTSDGANLSKPTRYPYLKDWSKMLSPKSNVTHLWLFSFNKSSFWAHFDELQSSMGESHKNEWKTLFFPWNIFIEEARNTKRWMEVTHFRRRRRRRRHRKQRSSNHFRRYRCETLSRIVRRRRRRRRQRRRWRR